MEAREKGSVKQVVEKAIFTNMCMVYNGDQVLVQDRVKPDWSGITFPGGHVELEESFVQSTIREVKEETGLEIWNLELCGTKQFILEDGTRYVVFLYKTNCYKGTLQSSREGEVFWTEVATLASKPLAPSFEQMLEIFLDDKKSECVHEIRNGQWEIRNY